MRNMRLFYTPKNNDNLMIYREEITEEEAIQLLESSGYSSPEYVLAHMERLFGDFITLRYGYLEKN